MINHTPTQYYAQPNLACATCGQTVVYTGNGTCSKCLTPLELSRSVALRDNPNRFISVLGQSGSGKTVYLGTMLDMLSQGRGELRGVPNDAFSVAVQQHTISALEQQRFPDKTPSEADQWNWVYCDAHHVKSPKKAIDLVTPDLAGEAIALEIEQPGTFPTIRTVVKNSSGVILLLDSEKVRDEGRAEDLFGIKMTTYLSSLQLEGQKKGRVSKLKLPLAILFTKADCCPEADLNPRKFAAEYLPGTVQVCKSKFAQHNFFAASVVGSTATFVDSNGAPVHIPLHVQPRGVVEPIAWVMKSITRRGR